MGKDPLHEFLETIRRSGAAQGNLQGLLHALVGRRITRSDGTVVSSGMTWRALARELKRHRWDRDLVQELGVKVEELAPRDRERFWYAAITHAHVDAPEAIAAGDALAESVRTLGYIIGPAPRATGQP